MNNKKELKEEIKLLILSYLQGTCSKPELEYLNSWLEADINNREYFNSMKTSWILVDKALGGTRFDETRLWNSLQSKINQPKKKRKSFIFRSVDYYQFARIAASWLFIFLLGSTLAYVLARKDLNRNASMTTINSPLGSCSHVILPDGSSVWLNAGTTLEYNTAFNTKTRNVKLSGEAFFNVTSNKSKPFIVNAQNILIKAYGTAFNVKAYSEEKKIVTTLVEGFVKIEGRDELKKNFSIIMEPKQKITCYIKEDFASVSKTEVNETQNLEKTPETSVPVVLVSASRDSNIKTELYTSWKDKRWIIQGEKFKDLALMLERRYNVKILFDSDEINNYRFSGAIENETSEQFFDILRLTMPIYYTVDKGVVRVGIDKKLKEKYKGAY